MKFRKFLRTPFSWLKRKHSPAKCVICMTEVRRMEILLNYDTWQLESEYFVRRFLWIKIQFVKKIHAKNTSVEEKWMIFIMTIVYSCLCFVSISRGLMTKPIGFLRVPPLKFVEQLSSFLEKFEQPTYSYPKCFSSWNYRKPQFKLRQCRFQKSLRGPAIMEQPSRKTGKRNSIFFSF